VRVPAPHDVGTECLDVGDVRACFSEGAPGSSGGVVPVPRPQAPRGAERGFRCFGAGLERACVERGLAADAFVCDEARCVQRHPRLPDDGEWECADLDGVVICRGGEPAAGTVAGPPDVGWVCGARRGEPAERICLDFSPERPRFEPWSCRFDYAPGAPLRSCTRGGAGPLWRPCGAGCPFGSVCAAGRCLPQAPHPDCWSSKDCAAGSLCAYGSCRRPPG
jgi:hypothetical protein